MALQSAKAGGSYFEFDQACNEGALIAFKIREFQRTRTLANGDVDPVLVDFVVLTGSQAKTVIRGESIIGGGIAPTLRRSAIGDDIVAKMGWGQRQNSKVMYVQANPATGEDMALAADVFAKTNGDPYTACERAANPTATLASAQPAPPPVQQYQPPAPVAAAPAAPAQPPAADAPAPWGAQPAAVGGPQGPGWGESPAATNAQPGAAGSVW